MKGQIGHRAPPVSTAPRQDRHVYRGLFSSIGLQVKRLQPDTIARRYRGTIVTAREQIAPLSDSNWCHDGDNSVNFDEKPAANARRQRARTA
jgi:hypothetical protein